jgi:hypothetical protein
MEPGSKHLEIAWQSQSSSGLANRYPKPVTSLENPTMVEHYRKGPSPRKFAMDWGLNPHLFNVIKYVARCNHKQYKNQDLHKAIWYLIAELTDNEEFCDEVVELVKKNSLS